MTSKQKIIEEARKEFEKEAETVRFGFEPDSKEIWNFIESHLSKSYDAGVPEGVVEVGDWFEAHLLKAYSLGAEDMGKAIGKDLEHSQFCKNKGEQYKECAKCLVDRLRKEFLESLSKEKPDV